MEPKVIQNAVTPLKDLLPEVYGDAAKPAMKVVGGAIGDALELCLLPITAVGYIPKMAKLYLNKHLESFARTLEDIPKEKQTEIHPQISVPVLQKLTYTSNDTIAELFVNLLASSANIDMSCTAHPGFVEIISQLAPDEAKIIHYLRGKSDIQYSEIKAYVKNGNGYNTYLKRSTLIPFEVNLDFSHNIHAYFSNLVRLGILEDKNGVYRIDQSIYNEIAQRYDFAEYEKLVPNHFKKIEVDKSYYEVTAFGKLFIQACTTNK